MTASEALKIVTECGLNIEEPSHEEAMVQIKSALEKQIPKKPDIYGDGYGDDGNIIYNSYDCPNCRASYEMEYEEYNYCPNCGQVLDWSEEESEND